MTHERLIDLTSWEAEAMDSLPAGGTMLLSRPIQPLKPRYDCIGHCEHCGLHRNAHDGYDCADGFAIAEDKCPWRVGDVLLCREPFQPIFADPETPGDYETGDGYKVRYVATEGRTEWYDGNVITNRCTPGSRMPRWAVRLRPTVISVRAVRIAEMSPSEAAQHGFSDAVISPGAIGELYQCWERRWGKRYPWASNPWAWTMEVQRGND